MADLEREDEGEEQAARLCDFVQARSAEILDRWESRARAVVPTARELSGPALRDHLPALLGWIAAVVRSAHTGGAPTPGLLPRAHGRSRTQEGYDLTEVVRELALLRRVILEMWEAEVGPTAQVREVIRLDDAIELVLARSVQAFADAQHEEVKERLVVEQELVGIVSHDLRNPLSAILTTAEGLLRRNLDDRSTRFVVRIHNAAERAERMVRDLLDFTRARLGGGIPVTRGPADLHAIVGAVLDEVRAQAADRELLHLHEGDGRADLDPDRVAQVAHNLVTNALKYSPPDTIVTVRTRGEEDHVSLEVHNLHRAPAADVI